ncbi:MAG: FGGY-family carbohydrate kinase [Atopobiaceae bacterium]|nr:FGGY-family carbohydrate kinase [Atopobiaceae bacterium]MCI2172630.1 FGGY-family carbohydrate kinase [Atopobiaceae bacterium]MCI2206937.1 FGGY-family carbohydrate kinase [Atopobiaceae bacterium]
MGRLFLGIDVGTNESKGVLIDEGCDIVAQRSVPHSPDNPRPGWFEMDADKTWWGDFCELSRGLVADAGCDAGQVACVGLSALGCDCVPVDEDCHALAPAVLYGVDSRASAEVAELQARYGSRETDLVGHRLCSSDIAPKILWFRHAMPEVWEKARCFLTASSYLSARLTGRFTIDRYLAEDFMPLYDLDSGEVAGSMCEGICRPDQLATLAAATDVAGKVSARAAAETGLAEGTPVLVGTGDSGAEAVSTGVFRPGDLMVQMGSTCYFVYLSDHLAQEERLWPGTFIIPGTYSVCAGTNTAGALTKWMVGELYPDAVAAEAEGGPNAFSVMAAEAASVGAGADGLVCLPYFAGERTPINDPEARGTFFGLTTNHTRAHLARAAIEGISCTIAQHVEILEADGLPVEKVMCVGGGTKNDVWLQCVADMLERPVCTASVTIGACYGDAIMAALAGGAYPDWDELSKVIRPGEVIEPQPENYETYRRLRATFSALYESTKDIMHAIARQEDLI